MNMIFSVVLSGSVCVHGPDLRSACGARGCYSLAAIQHTPPATIGLLFHPDRRAGVQGCNVILQIGVQRINHRSLIVVQQVQVNVKLHLDRRAEA